MKKIERDEYNIEIGTKIKKLIELFITGQCNTSVIITIVRNAQKRYYL